MYSKALSFKIKYEKLFRNIKTQSTTIIFQIFIFFENQKLVFPKRLSFDMNTKLPQTKLKVQGTAESVMCDVIKIGLKRTDERESGKGNP